MHPEITRRLAAERINDLLVEAESFRCARKAPREPRIGRLAQMFTPDPDPHDNASMAPTWRPPRLGLRRTPWLTIAVVAVTAAGGIAQHIFDGVLGRLERSPVGLHGQWWRIGTALIVQDGGLAGLVSNLIFLAAVGAVAEQVLARPRWMVQYLGTGLLAELVGYAWQPIGGGNSIAICGLVSAVSFTAWRDRARLPAWGPSLMPVWCGALLAPLWAPLIILGIVGGLVAGRAVQTGRPNGVPIFLGVLAAGAVLAAAANIHGAALVIGAVLALPRPRLPLTARTP